MRRSLYNIVLFTALIACGSLSSHPAFAMPTAALNEAALAKSRFEVEKIRKISKVFKVGPSDKLDIENKFGKVHINTWDKNEISVEVAMIARANSEEKAQNVLDRIDVKFNQSGNVISFRTELESINNKGKQGFEINYTVSMPKENPLRLKNSFGDSYLASYNGKADLDIGYGNLKAEQLLGKENTIKVSFGSGHITALKNCKLNISYSKLNLGSGEVLDVKNDFSDIEIDRVSDLTIQSKYGNVKLGRVNNLQGSTGFSDFRIAALQDNLDMKVQYCGDFEVEKIARNFKSINLDGGFSSFDLTFENPAAFNFDIQLAFGNIRLDKEQAQFSFVEKKNNSSHHVGKVGKASGSSNLKVKAQYGDVEINQAD